MGPSSDAAASKAGMRFCIASMVRRWRGPAMLMTPMAS